MTRCFKYICNGNIWLENGVVEIVGDPKVVLHQLVKEYEVLFGALSIKEMGFGPDELPEILR